MNQSQRVRLDLDDGPPVVARPAVQPTPATTNIPAAQPAAAPQTRSRGVGCAPGAIKTLLALAIVIVLTIAVLGLMGYRIPLANDVAKTIGYTIVTALTPNSMARLGYATIVVPVVLTAATWITARVRK